MNLKVVRETRSRITRSYIGEEVGCDGRVCSLGECSIRADLQGLIPQLHARVGTATFGVDGILRS